MKEHCVYPYLDRRQAEYVRVIFVDSVLYLRLRDTSFFDTLTSPRSGPVSDVLLPGVGLSSETRCVS